jgi:predicted GNAT family acetyltransferase
MTYRGLGLGALAVRSWAAAVQRSGRIALYSTSWDNLPSQGIAARLGAQQYGENWHLT